VLDRVGVVRAHFFEELLKVVRRQSCLALAVASGLCSTLHDEATYLLVDVATVVDHGLLVALFAPFLTGLGILLGTLDCGTGRHLPAAAWR
jgi:hypothetical protein